MRHIFLLLSFTLYHIWRIWKIYKTIQFTIDAAQFLFAIMLYNYVLPKTGRTLAHSHTPFQPYFKGFLNFMNSEKPWIKFEWKESKEKQQQKMWCDKWIRFCTENVAIDILICGPLCVRHGFLFNWIVIYMFILNIIKFEADFHLPWFIFFLFKFNCDDDSFSLHILWCIVVFRKSN